MGVGVSRPSHDAWVGVDPSIGYYVHALEVHINNFEVLQEELQLEHREEIAKLQALLAEKDREIGRLQQELALAKEHLKTSSRNSSKPPSSDPLSAPKRPPRRSSGKPRGGQVGHPFHPRRLYPVEQCASVVDHKPKRCRGCGHRLSGEDPDPLRHQIVDLPPIVPVVEEHRLHKLRCGRCGIVTHASLPKGTNGTGFGPGVEGAVAMLVAQCHLSHRLVVAVLRDLCGVRLGLGTVSKLLRRAGCASAAAVEEAARFVREYVGAKHVDETSWRQQGADGSNEDQRGAWIWVAATAPVTVLEATLSRGQEVAKRLAGVPTHGVLVSDRAKIYNFASTNLRQVCWAHLVRDFVRFTERDRASIRVGRGLLKVARHVFALQAKFRDGKLTPSEWEYYAGRLRMRARDYLRQGSRFDTDKGLPGKTKRTCEELLKIEPALWTFIGRPGLDATNNFAERQLRPAVIHRKVCYGSQSEDGMVWISRLLTVVMTLRSRGENPYEWLVEACRAARVKRAGPSLLPGKTAA